MQLCVHNSFNIILLLIVYLILFSIVDHHGMNGGFNNHGDSMNNGHHNEPAANGRLNGPEPGSNINGDIQSDDESEMEFCDTTDLYEVWHGN